MSKMLTVLKTLWQLHSVRARTMWASLLAVHFVQVMSEFALIYGLSAFLDNSATPPWALVALLGARVAVGVLSVRISGRLSGESRGDVQQRLWSATVTIRGYDHLSSSPAAHNRVLTHAPTDVGLGLAAPSATLLADGLALATLGAIGLVVMPSTMALAIVVLLAVVCCVLWVLKRSVNASRVEARALEAAHHLSWDVTNGVRDILINGARQFVLDRGEGEAQALRRATKSSQIWVNGQRTILDAVSLSFLALIVIFGISPSGAFLAAAVIMRMLPLVSRIGGNAGVMANAGARVVSWRRTLEMSNLPGNAAVASVLHTATGPLVAARLRPSKSGRLRTQIELSVSPGDWVVMRGPSGVGKSSVLDAIAGLWNAYEGEIRIGVLLERMGYATQAPFILPGTMDANVRLGRSVSHQQVNAAAGVSGLTEVFGEGWRDYVLLDRGTNISGGQRQRVSLCRALANAPDVLLLDEATANLDPEAEEIVTTRLREAYPDLAVVIVTHRPLALAWPHELIEMSP